MLYPSPVSLENLGMAAQQVYLRPGVGRDIDHTLKYVLKTFLAKTTELIFFDEIVLTHLATNENICRIPQDAMVPECNSRKEQVLEPFL